MRYPIEKNNYFHHAQNDSVSVIRELEDDTMCHLVNQDWRGYNCSGSIFNRGRVYLLSIVSSSFLLHTEIRVRLLEEWRFVKRNRRYRRKE